ncbi:MerR family transcriptional regulator [Citricoccus sp. K5]|uniref:MerR family transcriptional regulator n=1 Tax=Citricoccus sp. K5 TaxID=2653135 RepID=UPI0012F4688A|nr:MerR family transcriptional regulator [Citricoccus sp. K5]VXC02751.1 HTH-type transcriptional activator TipA [Citricoccus sp. K5]
MKNEKQRTRPGAHPEVALMTVGETASVTGVTVRTLHHYDEIGLVSPAARSSAGYRLYTPADLERLQQVVAYRRLGLGLEDIAAAIEEGPVRDGGAHPGARGARPAGRRRVLERQRELVEEKITELTRLLAALDTALEKDMKDIDLNETEMRELFGDSYTEHFEEYQAEAEDRWGQTEAWKESQRRTAAYSQEDWARISAETEENNQLILDAMDAGLPSDSERAMAAAEAMRVHMDHWFFPIDGEFHRNLGDMYVQDPRFMKTYEDLRPGLAQYLRDAIHANADRMTR